MSTFLQQICRLAREAPTADLPVADCRELLRRLLDQMRSDGESSDLAKMKGLRIVGQDALIERAIMTIVMNEHLLLEGLPGVAKTQAVRFLADDTGMVYLRVQFLPDMLPSDLIGKSAFDVRALQAVAQAAAPDSVDVEHWHNGPLFSNLLVADEINRAPSKVQAALLEAMGERQITPLGHSTHVIRSNREWEMWLRHIRALEIQKVIEGSLWGRYADDIGGRSPDELTSAVLRPAVMSLCNQRFDRFGPDFPFGQHGWCDPAPLFGASGVTLDSGADAQFTVFATQNPIEQAGTYPMSEAQVDRFNMKHSVPYPDHDSMLAITKMINRPRRQQDPDQDFTLPPELELTPTQRARRDLAIRASIYFFRRCRELLYGAPGCIDGSALDELFSESATAPHGPTGKMLRLVFYTHLKLTRTTRRSEAVALLYDREQQDRMRWLYRDPALRDDLRALTRSEVFEYINSGASPRGMLSLARTSLAHAFLKGAGSQIAVSDGDIRAVAENVLGHRIRLNSQARVRDLSAHKLLETLMEQVLED
jgi:MoxR-like ATPase